MFEQTDGLLNVMTRVGAGAFHQLNLALISKTGDSEQKKSMENPFHQAIAKTKVGNKTVQALGKDINVQFEIRVKRFFFTNYHQIKWKVTLGFIS